MGHVEVVRRNLSFEQWVQENFKRYRALVYDRAYPVGGWTVREGCYDPDGYAWEGESRPIAAGDRWGGPDVTAVFRSTLRIPDELAGQQVYFQLLTATEILASRDGKTIGALDPNRDRFLLAARGVAGESFRLTLEAYTRSKPDDDRNPLSASLRGCVQRFRTPRLVTVDREVLALCQDLEVLKAAAFGKSINQNVKTYLQHKVRGLLKLFPPLSASGEELRERVPALRAWLAEKVYAGGHPFAPQGSLACVAHSHLDIAYFWRVKQTVQKNARTVLLQLDLMNRYPEFTYAHSQAWTYEVLQKYYPELFQQVRSRVAQGRWEIVGGMYVEPDGNIPSAESLTRQVLYGKLYFQEALAVDVRNCWLPDIFGSSAVLPQILKKSGIDYFVSNKLSTWNDTNRFPHNHFIWRGVDGSEVYACVPPVHFITWMDPDQAAEHWEALQHKDLVHESLQMFGFGDGGSGATEDMIEYYRRHQNLPGVPTLRITTAQDFLQSAFHGRRDLPLWQGDLYLEMHRGTFTNKAALKAANRLGERLLQETEALCTLAAALGATYPLERLRKTWKKLLLNQAHDILPGTHVGPVTVDALADYQEITATCRELKWRAMETLSVPAAEGTWLLFNPDPEGRDGLAVMKAPPGAPAVFYLADQEGTPVPVQRQIAPDGVPRHVLPYKNLPGLSGRVYVPMEGQAAAIGNDLIAQPDLLESPFYRLELAGDGTIVSIHDQIRGRPLSDTAGGLNRWQLFEDTPGRYNAWDMVQRYEDRPLPLDGWTNLQVVETGPVSAAVRMERSFGSSRAVQVIRLFSERPRIDFETWVDWRESERLLKVAIETNVLTPVYACDNSAGVTVHENHWNTSWQQARYEVPCHRWVEVAEGNFGVALMNDCKYGCDVKGGTVRLSLLRASVRPDMYSDKGEHRFTYSLTTHGGHRQDSHLLSESHELNARLELLAGRRPANTSSPRPLLAVQSAGVRCVALKRAEDGSGDLIFRGTEMKGGRDLLRIEPSFQVKEAFLCSLLEKPERELENQGGGINLTVKPYEIVTIRLCE